MVRRASRPRCRRRARCEGAPTPSTARAPNQPRRRQTSMVRGPRGTARSRSAQGARARAQPELRDHSILAPASRHLRPAAFGREQLIPLLTRRQSSRCTRRDSHDSIVAGSHTMPQGQRSRTIPPCKPLTVKCVTSSTSSRTASGGFWELPLRAGDRGAVRLADRADLS